MDADQRGLPEIRQVVDDARAMREQRSEKDQPVKPFRSMVGETGIEPVTPGLEGRCSIQLSYSPVRDEEESRFIVAVTAARSTACHEA